MALPPCQRLIPLSVFLAGSETVVVGIILAGVLYNAYYVSDWAYLNNSIPAPQNNEDDWLARAGRPEKQTGQAL